MPASFFGNMRRVGFSTGVSKNKLAKAMVEILVQLPIGTAELKETVVAHLGLLGAMSATRDINAAWDQAKRQAAREQPERFMLDGKILRWDMGQARPEDRRPSAASLRKLAALAARESVSVDELIDRLLAAYRTRRRG
ncbi:MAG: hypothetical protein HY906_18135 [Deltaproteobacteria bacterium]|nr:hypothetical protein [Deltaproteobacteria bacterium]